MKKTDSLHNIPHSLSNENKFFHTEKNTKKIENWVWYQAAQHWTFLEDRCGNLKLTWEAQHRTRDKEWDVIMEGLQQIRYSTKLQTENSKCSFVKKVSPNYSFCSVVEEHTVIE